MLYKFPLTVPAYNSQNDKWSDVTFETLADFRGFADSLFKEPGKYDFDKTSLKFNEQARLFKKNKSYCDAPFKTKDFVKYWDAEKIKCTRGCIFTNGVDTWYLTRDYYMWLNFLPIYDKEENDFGFAKIRDAQYHLALFELRAELHYKHVALLKKRQIASSYFHAAKLLNAYWFEKGAVLKFGASREDYINLKGSWRFLNEYRDFLNKHTAWYRPSVPDKVLNWQQRIEVTSPDGKKSYKGNKSIFTGTSFEKDASAGVGGPCTYFFHEEGGIAPKADKTFFFMKPAMKSGMITTGVFIIAGSVGELEKCEPLKDMILKPGSDFMSVTHNLLDADGQEATTGLFIPEQWSMPPYIDKYGNSLIEEALAAIREERERWKIEYTPEKYQYEISQHPINIKEAFDFRTEAVFPVHLVQKRMAEIDSGEVPLEYLDIIEDNGRPTFVPSRRLPIPFPVDKKMEDKRGCIIVAERPPLEPEWGSYIASIDPVSEGKTTTSDSLFTIQIYKCPVERVVVGEGESKSSIEGDKMVCSWTGRYDDINDTHNQALLLIRMYNAWTLVEANVSLFIQFMIHKHMQKYLVPKDQIIFLQELKSNQAVWSAYGWKNTGVIFKGHLLSYAVEFTKEVLDQEILEDGKVLKTWYGIDRLHDKYLLQEMLQYRDGLNVDRLVAFSALVAFRALQLSNRGYKRIIEYKENFNNSKNLYKLKVSPFHNIGQSQSGELPPEYKIKRGFKNIR